MIGNNIVVTVLEVRGDQVRIGIDAPRSIQVHREEVYRQVASENRAASTPTLDAKALLQRRLRPVPPTPPATPPPTQP